MLSQLLGSSLPTERIEPATFPLPDAETIADAASARLLWNAARLVLREGASPLRSLGRISIRPRVYQFVPLLMALRLDPVRLLIADDVGVGKTIEACLIARELWDRAEIQRICVLCPPYLCDQWQHELTEKFNLPAVIIGTSTLSQLERNMPSGSQSIYKHYPIHIVSIDWVKTDRNRPLFVQECAEFLIVDEAHNAVPAGALAQQQRYDLVAELAQNSDRHLILLTATPHSGIPEAFQKLLGLLNSTFEQWNFTELNDDQRDQLAKHFVQRTRADIQQDWEQDNCFPARELLETQYRLSPDGHKLFRTTYDLCLNMVSNASLEDRKQRARYWGALALLRSVMSSPAAALDAVRNRGVPLNPEEEMLINDETPYENELMDPVLIETTDEIPITMIETVEQTLQRTEKKQLQDIAKIAKKMLFNQHDTKLKGCQKIILNLLEEGFNPIIWCRFVATAEYVAQALTKIVQNSSPRVQVICITGRLADEERRAKIAEISPNSPRILVATDCLSEGINLQELFNAAIHYDLPWNPNKLEQREGRVDRYGQTSPEVRTYRYYSPDNPVDGVVIRVLLEKAQEIRKTLGTYVPVPEENRSLQEALLNALFFKRLPSNAEQLQLDMEMDAIINLTQQMNENAEREKATRTRFAQRAMKPEEVQRELEAADKVLGDPNLVRSFLQEAAQRVGVRLQKTNGTSGAYKLTTEDQNRIPRTIREAIYTLTQSARLVSFDSPTPDGAIYIGRNHPFVQTVAQYLFESAISGEPNSPAKRCGAIATNLTSQTVALYLIRQRYLLQFPHRAGSLAEEARLFAVQLNNQQVLTPQEADHWFHQVQPTANLSKDQKQALLQQALNLWPFADNTTANHQLKQNFQEQLQQRVQELTDSHKRVRQSLKMKVADLHLQPILPPDLMGVLVITPVGGTR